MDLDKERLEIEARNKKGGGGLSAHKQSIESIIPKNSTDVKSF